MPRARHYLSAAANDGVLYAVGGAYRDSASAIQADSVLQVYDLLTDTWLAGAPVPVRWAWGNGASFIDGLLYITGGAGKALYVYDPATNQWARKADMPSLVQFGSQGVIDGKLYVYEGEREGAGALLRYDPTSDTWAPLAPPPQLHGNQAAAGVIDGKFYVAGGEFDYSPIPNVWAYDPGTDAWTARAPMPVALTGLAGGVIDGKLYVAGGGGCAAGCTGARTLYVYDPVTDTWVLRSSMPTGRLAAAGAVAQGKFFVLGGTTDSTFESTDALASVEAYTP